MSFKNYLYKSFTQPPHVVFKKALKKALALVENKKNFKKDLLNSTYSEFDLSLESSHQLFQKTPVRLLDSRLEEIKFFSDKILDHQFNLLGSGWVSLNYQATFPGRETYQYPHSRPDNIDVQGNWLNKYLNPGNVLPAQKIWQQISLNYAPIDWSCDFTSGFSWSAKTWSPHITYGNHPGVDIKAPWEISRMQHLPYLVWANLLAKEGRQGFTNPDTYTKEFQNQILDFMATNPPRFGPNWVCAMDVAIRACNWLVTYDLFVNNGASFNSLFIKQLSRSIYDHGLHIFNHLEWDNELRGNHYLSDLVGLLFISTKLANTPETNRWLFFAVFEFLEELNLQFNEDGSNFEGSTAYHQLSGELAVFGFALILSLPETKKEILRKEDPKIFKLSPLKKSTVSKWQPIFRKDSTQPYPDDFLEKLEKIAEFSLHISKPNHNIPQFGDNDSGHLFKLEPSLHHDLQNNSFEEEHLDHAPLISAWSSLFPKESFLEKSTTQPLIYALIKQLSHHHSFQIKNDVASLSNDSITLHPFSDFGIYTYQSNSFQFIIRCGPLGQRGHGGHSHNDQLSFELNVAGLDFIIDPGTYLYTPLAERRNQFRSTKMHNTLSLTNQEQCEWLPGKTGLFSLKGKINPQVIEANPNKFSGEHDGFRFTHRRTIDFSKNKIYGNDLCQAPGRKTLRFHLAPEVSLSTIKEDSIALEKKGTKVLLSSSAGEWSLKDSFYSPAYGKIKKTQSLQLTTEKSMIPWEIRLT